MKKRFVLAITITFLLMASIVGAANIAFSAEVVLTWKVNAETDLIEYRLYQTFTPGEYVYSSDSDNYTISIPAGTETITIFVDEQDVDFLYWVLTAVDADALESGPSNEVCIEDPEPLGNGGDGSCFIITISKVRRSK